jgi:hypothetical protein
VEFKTPQIISTYIHNLITVACSKSRPNLSGAEWRVLRTLETNAIMVLHANKGKAMMVIRTNDHSEKVSTFLRTPT